MGRGETGKENCKGIKRVAGDETETGGRGG